MKFKKVIAAISTLAMLGSFAVMPVAEADETAVLTTLTVKDLTTNGETKKIGETLVAYSNVNNYIWYLGQYNIEDVKSVTVNAALCPNGTTNPVLKIGYMDVVDTTTVNTDYLADNSSTIRAQNNLVGSCEGTTQDNTNEVTSFDSFKDFTIKNTTELTGTKELFLYATAQSCRAYMRTASINVAAVPATAVEVKAEYTVPNAAKLYPGESIKLTSTLTPANSTDKVTYEFIADDSANTNVTDKFSDEDGDGVYVYNNSGNRIGNNVTVTATARDGVTGTAKFVYERNQCVAYVITDNTGDDVAVSVTATADNKEVQFTNGTQSGNSYNGHATFVLTFSVPEGYALKNLASNKGTATVEGNTITVVSPEADFKVTGEVVKITNTAEIVEGTKVTLKGTGDYADTIATGFYALITANTSVTKLGVKVGDTDKGAQELMNANGTAMTLTNAQAYVGVVVNDAGEDGAITLYVE